MNTAEIVMREVQSDCGFQIIQLFRESIGQSGKTPHLHSHNQILPFHVRRADMFLKANAGRKGCGTRCAAVTLDSVTTITAKLLNGGVLTFCIGHSDSPLALCGEKPENTNWDRYCGSPRDAGLFPAPASTEAGTVQRVKGLGWRLDRDIYGVTGSGEANRDRDFHCCFILSESPAATGLSYLLLKSFPTNQPENYSSFLGRFLFKFVGYESLGSGHNRTQRLGIFLNVEAGFFKLFTYLSRIHAVLYVRQHFQDGFRESTRFPLRCLHILQDCLAVIFGHQAGQPAQCAAEFADAIVIVTSQPYGLFQLSKRFLNNLVVVHRHNAINYQ